MASLRTVPTMKQMVQHIKQLPSMTQSLTTPNTLAHVFDWKKTTSTVLTLRITKQTIDCGIVTHPIVNNNSNNVVDVLPSIPLEKLKNDDNSKTSESSATSTGPNFNVNRVTSSLQRIVQDYDVCGIVVIYPTSSSSNGKNASTGRALHVLDHLPNIFAAGKNGSSTSSKPICLFDPNQSNVAIHDEDEWGRTQAYCTDGTSAKVVHCAKQLQHSDNATTSTVLELTWKNFVQQYWPNVASDSINENDIDDDLTDFILTKLSHAKIKTDKASIGSGNSAFIHSIPQQSPTRTVPYQRLATIAA